MVQWDRIKNPEMNLSVLVSIYKAPSATQTLDIAFLFLSIESLEVLLVLETHIKLEGPAVTSWDLTLYHIFLCCECALKPQSLDVHKNYTISFYLNPFYLFTIYFNCLSNTFSVLLSFFRLIPSHFFVHIN